MKVVAIQMNPSDNKDENLRVAKELIESAVRHEKPDLILLPEMFTYLGSCNKTRKEMAEDLACQSADLPSSYHLLSALAKEHQIIIHGGSVCEYDDGSYYNTSYVFDRSGTEIAKYRKIHLFEIKVEDQLCYNECAFYQHGRDLCHYDVVVSDTNYTIGATICFDIRFPELFGKLRQAGCHIIMIPAAFFKVTGQDHWETLCRARAIETQSYVVTAAQTGTIGAKGSRREYWGHSMIIDPWGNIVSDAGTGVGYISAEIDINLINHIRERIPIQSCRQEI